MKDFDEVNLKEFIRNYIKDHGGELEYLNDDTDLISSHIISSLTLISLLVEIEDFLQFDVVNDKLGIENFSSITNIIKTVNEIVSKHQDV